jgi:hypothetical protein
MGDPLRVLIAGGGVAGLETLLALDALAGDRLAVTLLDPGAEFIYRPMTVAQPFAAGRAARHPLAKLAAAASASSTCSTRWKLEPRRRTVTPTAAIGTATPRGIPASVVMPAGSSSDSPASRPGQRPPARRPHRHGATGGGAGDGGAAPAARGGSARIRPIVASAVGAGRSAGNPQHSAARVRSLPRRTEEPPGWRTGAAL